MHFISVTIDQTLYQLPPTVARQIANQILIDLINADLERNNRRPLSPLAGRVLGFIHNHLEMHRATPSRQQIADYVELDRKMLIPIMEELRLAGWRRAKSRQHRADDWGGVYRRPLSPPFSPDESKAGSPKTGKPLVQSVLF